jgi:cell division transport system permease protein
MKYQMDLPLHQDITARFVPKIVALMVYLGSLCFVFTLFMIHSSSSWEKEFTTHLSVEIPSLNDAPATALQNKVLKLLDQTPGVGQATVVPQKEMGDLFRSLLGEEIKVDVFSLPVMVDISLEPGEKMDVQALEGALRKISPHIHLTDHRDWQRQVSNLIHACVFIAFFVTTLTLFAALVTATFATKTSLLIHHRVVEILNLIGATDSYIAKQFQMHTLKQALIASGIGAAGAFITFFVIVTLLENVGLPLALHSSFFFQALCVFILAPFLTAAIMMLTVYYSVMRELRSC